MAQATTTQLRVRAAEPVGIADTVPASSRRLVVALAWLSMLVSVAVYGFWRAVLGYAELDDDNAVDPIGHGSPFTGQRPTPGKSWPSSTPADARSVLAGPSAPKDLDPIVAARS